MVVVLVSWMMLAATCWRRRLTPVMVVVVGVMMSVVRVVRCHRMVVI